MIKETAGRKTTNPRSSTHEATGKKVKDRLAAIESYLPAGSPQRAAAGIAAAAGGALLAAAVVGVGPAALAGAAGYLVYRESHKAS